MTAYERYVEIGYTVYIIERTSGMPIDYTFEDIRDDYARAVEEIAQLHSGEPRSGVNLVGVGAGGLFALAVAARAESGETGAVSFASPLRTPVTRLVLISSAARMSDAARSAAGRWQEAAEHLRWRDVHRDMVTLSHVGPSAVFYSTIAWLFPNLLGTTDYPWDFVITVRETAGTDVSDQLTGIEVPTLFLGGERDRLFLAEDMKEAARELPHADAQLFPGGGHAVAKSRTREVERRVLSFLRNSDTETGGETDRMH